MILKHSADASGRQSKTSITRIHAHSDVVTDFAFSPFDDGLLATGSQVMDTRVRVYSQTNIYNIYNIYFYRTRLSSCGGWRPRSPAW